MARSQFTFTFRNATPGAAVTFSAAVYSSKADQVADGPALALDSARTVAVWADVPELTATWVDAAGTSVEAEASLAVPVVVVETGGVPGASPGTTGGSAPVDSALIAYTTNDVTVTNSAQDVPFVFDAPGTNTGDDVSINGSGYILFNTAGRYIISVDLTLNCDASAVGHLVLKATASGTALPDVSYLSWGNDEFAVPLLGGQTFNTNLTLPEDAFAAGSIVHFTTQHLAQIGAGGTVVLTGGSCMIYVRRTA